MFKLFLIAALLICALGVAVSSTTQQALADKVSPVPGEDRVKQGGLGEYHSQDGKKEYYPGVSNEEFGRIRGDIASSDPNLFGANAGFYASGECHSDTERKACK